MTIAAMNDTMSARATTPKELKQLAKALAGFSHQLDAYIATSDNPYTVDMRRLQSLEAELSMDAAEISSMAVSLGASGVVEAIGDLAAQIDQARRLLRDVDHAKRALSLVAGVLTAAAAIMSESPLAAAPAVLGLVDAIKGAITANS